jgi:hypothetical protein
MIFPYQDNLQYKSLASTPPAIPALQWLCSLPCDLYSLILQSDLFLSGPFLQLGGWFTSTTILVVSSVSKHSFLWFVRPSITLYAEEE